MLPLSVNADNSLNSFISDTRWKNGVSWTSSQTPKLSSFSSSGCCAYCADYVKYCYGINNPRSGEVFYDINETRAGDIITVGNQSDGTGHWMVVIERNGNSLKVAEGNFNYTQVRVGWNYTISGNKLAEDSRNFTAGYHYLDGTYANLGDDFYAVHRYPKLTGLTTSICKRRPVLQNRRGDSSAKATAPMSSNPAMMARCLK